jgi:hypothetical protein
MSMLVAEEPGWLSRRGWPVVFGGRRRPWRRADRAAREAIVRWVDAKPSRGRLATPPAAAVIASQAAADPGAARGLVSGS